MTGTLKRDWHRAQQRDVSVEAKRGHLKRQQVRLRDLYLAGDLDRAEYQQRRDATQRELDALPAGTGPNDDSAAKLVEYLANVANAWRVATPEERNRLARELFTEAIVTNNTAVAVVPRPEVRPFFNSMLTSEITQQRKRRGLVQHLQYPFIHPVRVAVPDLLPREGTLFGTQCYRSRPRKLTPDQLKAIQRRPHRTLRELAAEYGVSHETIRAARRTGSTEGE